MPVLAYLCLLAAATTAQVAPSYSIETVAGSNFAGDGGSALSALLSQPEGLLFDSLGRLYIADADDHRVRRVDNDGT
ncbi:MAG: RICIN domain-containing protein, partial [Bryobacteraceae bacterium]